MTFTPAQIQASPALMATYERVAAAFRSPGAQPVPGDTYDFPMAAYSDLLELDVSTTPSELEGPGFMRGQAARRRVRVVLEGWFPTVAVTSPQVWYVTDALRQGSGIAT